jgi:hypothetical protein
MRQILLTTTILGLPFALGAAVEAQDIRMGTPLSSNDVPNGGLRTYQGTFDLGSGVTGIIKLFADFKSRSMSADLTIPPLRSDGAVSSPENYAPSGPISKDAPVSYTLTQGTAYSPEPQGTRHDRQSRSAHILLTGSFWGPGASTRETSGTFVASFCVPETNCRETSSVAGTYSASAIR